MQSLPPGAIRTSHPDVLAWFKARGPGYQTRINAALRAFVEAHDRQP